MSLKWSEGNSSMHQQINMPNWGTKGPSISLDFQKQVSHVHKWLSVPAASKRQTPSTQRTLRTGPMEGQLHVFLKT